MRDQPIAPTPWEMEAARRREVIAADFGARTERPAEPRARSVGRIGPIRRVTALISAIARTGDRASASHVDRSAACQPGIGAVEPGS